MILQDPAEADDAAAPFVVDAAGKAVEDGFHVRLIPLGRDFSRR